MKVSKNINVLSLFDGISCAQIALNKIGINNYSYFASEIDKYAIMVSKHNFPNTKHIGDIEKIRGKDIPEVDLLIGGFPCQSFSFAGKQQNFKDSRGKLFFECIRLLKEVKPKYFIFENVKMKKEYQDRITELIGTKPILINSSLVSAQNRKRLYWTNIKGIKQPEDRNILLKDIIEKGVTDRQKSYCIDANYFKGGNLKQYFKKKRRQIIFKANIKECQQVGVAVDIKGFESIKRVYSTDGKSPTLTTMTGGHREPKIKCADGERVYIDDKTQALLQYRKLTPLECERLQNIPDNYTSINGRISKSQRYKMIGNAFTVDIIVHILEAITEW